MTNSTLRLCGLVASVAALWSGCARRPDHLPPRADRTAGAHERADFTRVWNARAAARTLAIRTTAPELIVEPPTLPAEVYRLDGSEYTSVRDVGTWWIKNRTRLQWIDNRKLTLTTTSFTGRWHVQRPSEVTR